MGLLALNLSTLDAQRALPAWATPSLPVVPPSAPHPHPPFLVGQKTKQETFRCLWVPLEPRAGGEGWGPGCRQGMLFKTKKEMLARKERKGSRFLLLVVVAFFFFPLGCVCGVGVSSFCPLGLKKLETLQPLLSLCCLRFQTYSSIEATPFHPPQIARSNGVCGF